MDAAVPRGPGPRLTWLLIGVLCLVWGSTWLVIQEGLTDLPPFTALGLRFALAFVVFAAVAPWLHGFEGGERPSWRLTLVMGVAIDALSYGIVYWSEQTIPSGLTSVLWGVFPILMAVAGHFLLPGERLRPLNAVGFAVGFAGLAVLFATDLRQVSDEAVWAGMVLLLSPCVTAVGTVVIKRTGSKTSSVLLCRNGLAVAAALVLPVALFAEHDVEIAWTGRALFSIAYLAVLGTVVTFSLYFWLLRYAPASKLALIAYVCPAVALVLGWAIRGERLGATTIVGSVLIVLGVGVAGRSARPRRSGGR